jgi:hypothetical protein
LNTFAPNVVNETSIRQWKEVPGAYDLQGILVRTEETTTTQRFLPTASLGDAKVLENTETATRNWTATALENGLPKAFHETSTRKVIDTGGGELVNTTSSLSRSEIVYDKSRMLSYKETADNAGVPSEKTWAASGFDAFGRPTGYTEKGYVASSGDNDYARSAMTYTTDGFVSGYKEEGLVGGSWVERDWGLAATLVDTIDPPATQYDVMGRLLAQRESGWTDAGPYEKVQTGINYNLLSQLTSYVEKGWNNAQGLYNKIWNNATYDTKRTFTFLHSNHQ